MNRRIQLINRLAETFRDGFEETNRLRLILKSICSEIYEKYGVLHNANYKISETHYLTSEWVTDKKANRLAKQIDVVLVLLKYLNSKAAIELFDTSKETLQALINEFIELAPCTSVTCKSKTYVANNESYLVMVTAVAEQWSLKIKYLPTDVYVARENAPMALRDVVDSLKERKEAASKAAEEKSSVSSDEVASLVAEFISLTDGSSNIAGFSVHEYEDNLHRVNVSMLEPLKSVIIKVGDSELGENLSEEQCVGVLRKVVEKLKAKRSAQEKAQAAESGRSDETLQSFMNRHCKFMEQLMKQSGQRSSPRGDVKLDPNDADPDVTIEELIKEFVAAVPATFMTPHSTTHLVQDKRYVIKVNVSKTPGEYSNVQIMDLKTGQYLNGADFLTVFYNAVRHAKKEESNTRSGEELFKNVEEFLKASLDSFGFFRGRQQ